MLERWPRSPCQDHVRIITERGGFWKERKLEEKEKGQKEKGERRRKMRKKGVEKKNEKKRKDRGRGMGLGG